MDFKNLKVKNLLILSSLIVGFVISTNVIYASSNTDSLLEDMDTDYASDAGEQSNKTNDKSDNYNNTFVSSSYYSSYCSSDVNGKQFNASSQASNQVRFENGTLISSNVDKKAELNIDKNSKKSSTQRRYDYKDGGKITDKFWENDEQKIDYNKQYELDNIKEFNEYKDSTDKLNRTIDQQIDKLNSEMNYNSSHKSFNNKKYVNNDTCNNYRHNKTFVNRNGNKKFEEDCIGEDCRKNKCFGPNCNDKNGKYNKADFNKYNAEINNLNNKIEPNINQIEKYNNNIFENDVDYEIDTNRSKNNQDLLNNQDTNENKSANIITPVSNNINEKKLLNNENEIINKDNNELVIPSNKEHENKPLVTDNSKYTSINTAQNMHLQNNNTIPLLSNEPAWKEEEYKKFSSNKDLKIKDKSSTNTNVNKSTFDDDMHNGPIEPII